jgi:hypothetical protein
VNVLVTPHGRVGEKTHEKESDENKEYPDDEHIEGPPPIEVLESVNGQSVRGRYTYKKGCRV